MFIGLGSQLLGILLRRGRLHHGTVSRGSWSGTQFVGFYFPAGTCQRGGRQGGLAGGAAGLSSVSSDSTSGLCLPLMWSPGAQTFWVAIF